MKSILVTGGSGFIGSHTCLALLEKGYNIFSLDSYINSSQKSLLKVVEILEIQGLSIRDKLHIYKGNLNDELLIKKIFEDALRQKKEIYGVIHFAGLKSVKESVSNPILYWENNLSGSITLLKVMNQFNCRNIVFSSSATIYGETDKEFINELANIGPINPYGQTKLAIEKFLEDIYKTPKKYWSIANLRYFNPIGAHSSGLIGEDPIGMPNNIFPYLTAVALGKYKMIKIFGNDWPTKDGTCIRDYIHVMDLAEGHLKTLEYLFNNKSQFINMNLGTGLGVSVLELIKTFENVNNINIPYVFTKRREGDVARLVADNSYTKSVLSWKPKRSLNDMCKDGWKWQLNNPKGFYE